MPIFYQEDKLTSTETEESEKGDTQDHKKYISLPIDNSSE